MTEGELNSTAQADKITALTTAPNKKKTKRRNMFRPAAWAMLIFVLRDVTKKETKLNLVNARLRPPGFTSVSVSPELLQHRATYGSTEASA